MKVFAVTTAFNENFFLPRWVSYYGSQVGQENLFVLDHGSTDISTLQLGRANIIRVPRSVFDDVKRAAFVSNFFCSMLSYYDAGFASDVDEFIVADPRKYRTLVEFANTTRATALACMGLELFHIRHLEPDFREHLPILSQRRHVLFDSWMCKRSFASQPMRFGGGLHTSDQPVAFDESLYLIHLKNFEYSFRLARQQVTSQWHYAGDFSTHARRSVRPGLDFHTETAKCLERTVLNPSGEYDFNLNGGFLGDDLRTLPPEFRVLF
jgi:hypothetical protein